MTLSKRDAKLRAEAIRGIGRATSRLSGAWMRDALRSALYDHPRAALLQIARAEVHLRRAKRALRAWAGRAA